MSNIIPTPPVATPVAPVAPVAPATPVAPKAAEATTSVDPKVDFWANAWANRGK
jgi:hypothetical protein